MNTPKAIEIAPRYFELVRQFPLRPIRSEAELDRAIAMVDTLIDIRNRNPEENDYLDVLGDLIHRYEQDSAEEDFVPPPTDAEMLRYLIEIKGVTQAQLATDTRIAESTISLILSGKRSIAKKHVGVFAAYFHVSPASFISMSTD